MQSVLLSCCLFLSVFVAETNGEGQIWALLAAGGMHPGWGSLNYAIEANVFAAYQMMHGHGIPDERIVVMAYDDIVNNTRNPHPGVIISWPNGPNVYENALRDYIGDDVTAENFLKVLRGDEEGMKGIGSGKVIKSGPEDHVFVFLMDHGGDNLIVFPTGELLHSTDLNQTLSTMVERKQFKDMTIYIDACHSGSMFSDHLSSKSEIYGVSSAQPDENTIAVFCNHTHQHICMGSEFTYSWLRDTRKENLTVENLQTQFDHVKKEMKKVAMEQWKFEGSTANQYGDTKVAENKAAEFQGANSGSKYSTEQEEYTGKYSAMPLNDIPHQMHKLRVQQAKTPEEKLHHLMKLKSHQGLRKMMTDFVHSLVQGIPVYQPDYVVHEEIIFGPPPTTSKRLFCHKKLVNAFSTHCFPFNQNLFARRFSPALANLCETGVNEELFLAVMKHECSKLDSAVRGFAIH